MKDRKPSYISALSLCLVLALMFCGTALAGEDTLLVLIKPSISSQLSGEISTFTQDLKKAGYKVQVQVRDFEEFPDLMNYLRQNPKPAGIYLVGEYPFAFAGISIAGNQGWIMNDKMLMDLDNSWKVSKSYNDNLQKFDYFYKQKSSRSNKNKTLADRWVTRIIAPSEVSSEVKINYYKQYFDKLHRYKTGNMNYARQIYQVLSDEFDAYSNSILEGPWGVYQIGIEPYGLPREDYMHVVQVNKASAIKRLLSKKAEILVLTSECSATALYSGWITNPDWFLTSDKILKYKIGAKITYVNRGFSGSPSWAYGSTNIATALIMGSKSDCLFVCTQSGPPIDDKEQLAYLFLGMDAGAAYLEQQRYELSYGISKQKVHYMTGGVLYGDPTITFDNQRSFVQDLDVVAYRDGKWLSIIYMEIQNYPNELDASQIGFAPQYSEVIPLIVTKTSENTFLVEGKSGFIKNVDGDYEADAIFLYVVDGDTIHFGKLQYKDIQ